MTTTLKQVLAGIGTKKASTPDMSAVAIASSNYSSVMKSQMQAIMQSYAMVIGSVDKVLPQIMYEALEPTLEIAKEYAPVKTGMLRDSGYLDIRAAQGNAEVIIGFAKGGDPEYAAIVHERVDLKHAYPTRSKFLSAALNEDMANVYGRIVTRCQI